MIARHTVTAVRAGQLATFEASGDQVGWVRRPVPADGLLVETDVTTVFLPREVVEEKLAEIPPRKVRR